MISAVLIAATLPFVVSIIIAFSPGVRTNNVGGYFLYERNLDPDGFVKVTVGYSLQVAAIALFFYWTFSFGVVGPALVCLAWGAGYFAIASALRHGKLNAFLGSARTCSPNSTPTIHGYIGNSVVTGSKQTRRKWTIAAVALASIIGLGGTMMAEIDYGVTYLGQAIGLPAILPGTNLFLAAGILAFTVLYVLWGGYRSAVATDRLQVPVAYVAFAIFTLAIATYTGASGRSTGVGFALLAFAGIISILMWRRLRLTHSVSPQDIQSRLSAFFTFLPIVLLSGAAAVYISDRGEPWNWAALRPVLFPEGAPILGFPLLALFALLVVNSLWQLIDISSLQRLQSLGSSAVGSGRSRPAVRILRAMGVEAGLGWILIIIAAVILKSSGLGADTFISELSTSDLMSWVVPLFIFTVFVYMLSTISGFISALSYISFYDIVPILTGRPPQEIKESDGITRADELRHPRLTTIVVIAFTLIFYGILRVGIPSNKIASVLYAIYAFQIVILPSALVAIFSKKRQIRPSAVVLSVLAGILAAYFTAAHPFGLRVQSWLGADDVSWQVMPPLVTAIVACAMFLFVSVAIWFVSWMRGSKAA